MEERIDEIGFSGYRLIQRSKDFCYGIDAVLLAAFAGVRQGGRVCDLGTGTGIIPLIMRHKTEAAEFWGVELQKEFADLAVRTMKLNRLEETIHILHSDVRDAAQILGFQSFDTVVANPPYVKKGCGLVGERSAKTLARHESSAGFSDFAQAAADLLKDRGDFYVIHREFRLAELIFCCTRIGLEPKELRMVAPKRGQRPNLVLLHCVKSGGQGLSVLPELAVYQEDGTYTQEILEFYERVPAAAAEQDDK